MFRKPAFRIYDEVPKLPFVEIDDDAVEVSELAATASQHVSANRVSIHVGHMVRVEVSKGWIER